MVSQFSLFSITVQVIDCSSATRGILPGTLIDVSPVLLFSKEDYDAYAKKTVIDDYAFVWGDGRMALVLGLGT